MKYDKFITKLSKIPVEGLIEFKEFNSSLMKELLKSSDDQEFSSSELFEANFLSDLSTIINSSLDDRLDIKKIN